MLLIMYLGGGVKVKKVIIGILISAVFYILFYLAMTSHERAKSINDSSVKTYKVNIKNEFSWINNLKVYHRFGRVFFEFNLNYGKSLDEYKSVVKKTREFVIEEGVSNLITKGYVQQQTIRVEFKTINNIYSFECPYQILDEDINENLDKSVSNNYKIWDIFLNDDFIAKIEL
jgi:hypothetical protein